MKPLWRCARFEMHVGARPLPRRGWTCALGGLGDTPTFVALICKSVQSFPTRTLPEYRFWKGSHLKTSNEIASEGVTEAFSFDVLQRSPCQNSRFWSGWHFKTSNEIVLLVVAEAISLDVLKSDPFQNLCFGGVGVPNLRTT